MRLFFGVSVRHWPIFKIVLIDKGGLHGLKISHICIKRDSYKNLQCLCKPLIFIHKKVSENDYRLQLRMILI